MASNKPNSKIGVSRISAVYKHFYPWFIHFFHFLFQITKGENKLGIKMHAQCTSSLNSELAYNQTP